jgi:hypothetical protein
MSSSRFLKAFVAGVFAASILLSSPSALAYQRVDDPRGPIVRLVKYIQKILSSIALDDGMNPPHP